jgi:hypothetical protein
MMSEETRDQASEGKRELARKLDAGGWGLFFIWIGIAVYTSVGWGATLFGIGVITLASQLVRKYSGLPFERFWLVVGALFVFGGLWKALAIGLGRPAIAGAFVPIVCIAAGAILLVSALSSRRAERPGH